MAFIAADPYPWPYDGDLRPDSTTLIVIDMQTDFCGKGGYIDLLGYDLSNSRACIEPISAVLGAFRKNGFHIIPHPRGSSPRPRRSAPPTSAGARGDCRAAALARSASETPVLWARAGSRRARLGHHPRALSAARRAHHRQARQGVVLRHRSRPSSSGSAASATSCSRASRPTCAFTPRCAKRTTAATSA